MNKTCSIQLSNCCITNCDGFLSPHVFDEPDRASISLGDIRHLALLPGDSSFEGVQGGSLWFGIEIPISGTLPSAIFIVLGSCALGKCDNHSAGMHGVWGNWGNSIGHP